MRDSSVGRCTVVVFAAGLLLAAWGQRGGGRGVTAGDLPELPPPAAVSSVDIGRAKAEREQNLKDATRLAELAEKVRHDLEGSSSFTLSISTIKNTEELEKLSRKLHSRLKSGTPRPDQTPEGYDASHVGPPPKR